MVQVIVELEGEELGGAKRGVGGVMRDRHVKTPKVKQGRGANSKKSTK